MEFVSWDDDIPNIWTNKNHVPDHQPAFFSVGIGCIYFHTNLYSNPAIDATSPVVYHLKYMDRLWVENHILKWDNDIIK